jgi:phage host-nuclease inhibitor protein Gam
MELSRKLMGLAVILALLMPPAMAQEVTDISARLSELNILRAQTRNLASEYADKKATYEQAQKNNLGDADSQSRLNNAKFQYFLIERKYSKKKEELLKAELALEQLQAQQPMLAEQPGTAVSPGMQPGIIFQGPSTDDEIERLNATLDERERRIDDLLSQLDALKARPMETTSDRTNAAVSTEQVSNLRAEIRRLNTQVNDYEAEIDALRNRVVALISAQDVYEEERKENPVVAAAPMAESCDCDESLENLAPAFVVARDTGMSDEQRERLARVLNNSSATNSTEQKEINLFFPGPNTYQLWQQLRYLGEDIYLAEATVVKGELQIRVGDWYWQGEIAHKDHQKNVSFYLDTRGQSPQLFIHRNEEAILALR